MKDEFFCATCNKRFDVCNCREQELILCTVCLVRPVTRIDNQPVLDNLCHACRAKQLSFDPYKRIKREMLANAYSKEEIDHIIIKLKQEHERLLHVMEETSEFMRDKIQELLKGLR